MKFHAEISFLFLFYHKMYDGKIDYYAAKFSFWHNTFTALKEIQTVRFGLELTCNVKK